ncbi:MAG: nucleoside triphosphate pyrophosphohydrolase [Patescibacteria group bacterium]
MKKIYYHKLVRDRIPHIISTKGAQFFVKKLSLRQFETELYKKVGEEASGLLATKNRQELTSELADIYEVLKAIRRYKKIKPSCIRYELKKNMKRKGGFAKRLYLVWAEDDGYRTNEKIYKK